MAEEPEAVGGALAELVLLGTAGGPPPVANRTGISSLLRVDGFNYVIDCGRSAVTQYVAAGMNMRDLEAIFITHLHADHVADLFNFFVLCWKAPAHPDGLLRPVHVFGPGSAGDLPQPYGSPEDFGDVNPENPVPGTAAFMQSSLAAYAYHANIFHRDGGLRGLQDLPQVQEIRLPEVGAGPHGPTAPRMAPFRVMKDERVAVSAILVPHGLVFPSFAYRFDSRYGSVVFSGDTAPSDNVVELARGADVLVHEVMSTVHYEELGMQSTAIEHFRHGHTDVQDLGRIAADADVGRVVLSHFAPNEGLSDDDWVRGLRSGGFEGQVTVGADLLRLRLSGGPRNSGRS